ncbi:hypothetical protein KXW34_008315, partial [Aspergillus fumigatus]
ASTQLPVPGCPLKTPNLARTDGTWQKPQDPNLGSSAGSILITPRDPHSASAAATSSGVASGRRAAKAVVAEMPRRRA